MKSSFSSCCFVSTLIGFGSLHGGEVDLVEGGAHDSHAEFKLLTGEGAEIGGFLYPEIYLNATGGVFGSGIDAADLATAEHDPQNDFGIQGVEVHLDIDFDGLVTGAVYGSGFKGADEWEAALE